MSRIYEALQKAELDHNGTLTPDADFCSAPLPGNHTQTTFVDPPPLSVNDIPASTWTPTLSSLPTLADRGRGVEQFRSLRSNIFQLHDKKALKTIVVSSGMPGEGKTFVAVNLAISLARNSDSPVLLIDGDMRRPTVHALLGAASSPGLAEYLDKTTTIDKVMQRYMPSTGINDTGARPLSHLTLIAAGAGGDRSPELAGNHRMEELVSTLSPHFSWIIIDSPPVLIVSDAVDLARAADGVLLVARGASTPFDVAQKAQAAFSGSRILGFVLNAVKHTRHSGSTYYYDDYDTQKPAGSLRNSRS